MTITREIAEGTQPQGADEEITYALTVTNWSGLTSVTGVKVYDITDNTRTDVTATVMPVTTTSIVGDKIIFSPLKSLTPGRTYRLEPLYVGNGNKLEPYAIIQAEY